MALIVGVGQPEVVAKLKAWNGTDWVNLKVQDSAYPNLRVSLYSYGARAGISSINAASVASTISGLNTLSFLYAFNGAAWDRLRTQAPGYPNLRVCIAQDNNVASVWDSNGDNANPTDMCLFTTARLYGLNGSKWDRLRTHTTQTYTLTSTGATSAFDSVTGFSKHSWQVLSDASASNVTVAFEVSIDGTNWDTADTWSGVGNSPIKSVVELPVRYIRFNLTNMGDATSVTIKYFGMR